MTEDLDGVIQQLPAPPAYYPGSYPHQAGFDNDLNREPWGRSVRQLQLHPTVLHVVDDESIDFPLSPFTDQPPPTPVTDDRDQPFGSPPQTASPLSPFVETPVRSPTPQPLPLETAPKYVMELRIVTKTKGKRGKAGEDFKITKSPIRLSLDLTYLQFLKEVAKVAEVKVSQLDCEHMRWRPQKPASASPTNVSEDESYGIMIQAIQSKKTADRWIIIEMGKPLLSEAVGLTSLLTHMKAQEITLSHGLHLQSGSAVLLMKMTKGRIPNGRFVLEPMLGFLLILLRLRLTLTLKKS